MRVLLIGSGGREDALAWAIGRSPRLELLRCAPGNAGIGRRAERVRLAPDDVRALVAHARAEAYDLVIVGPEAPLVAGLADRLREEGIAVFGPGAKAARLEGSKAFAKCFMERHGIPTAGFRLFHDAAEATRFLASADADYPLVIKADGLAAGKGVFVLDEPTRAIAVARELLEERTLGEAGARIVVEQCLRGREVSYFALADGERWVEMATCQDYKRAHDGDRGPNTGGMGSYSPSAFVSEADRETIRRTILRPTIEALSSDLTPFCGVLFAGLMLTDLGPRVLEFNVRFGDPEAQVLLPRLHDDWLEVLYECATGSLTRRELRWRDEAAVAVVLASDGYPGPYTTGHPIHGVEAAEAIEGVTVFHSGTALDDGGRLVTAGGRVLAVTALGPSLAAAREQAYRACEPIRWQGVRYRCDVAADALAAVSSGTASPDLP